MPSSGRAVPVRHLAYFNNCTSPKNTQVAFLQGCWRTSARADAFAQAHDPQHGAITHFGVRPAFEDVLDELGAVGSDFARPVDQATGRMRL